MEKPRTVPVFTDNISNHVFGDEVSSLHESNEESNEISNVAVTPFEVDPFVVPSTEQHGPYRRSRGKDPTRGAAQRRQKFSGLDIVSIGNWWLLELLAVLLSLLALGTLIGVLAYYDGKPQRTWRAGGDITLNAVVAAIATVTRTSLMVAVGGALSQGMWNWFAESKGEHDLRDLRGEPLRDLEVFDGASRGSWGSLMLLWRLKGGHLASIGAALTILSLGFDTFSQQVLSVKYMNVNGDIGVGAGAVPRSEVYSSYVQGFTHGDWLADVPIRAAIYSGVLGGNVSTEIPVYCSTGNCTYPTTTSLGVCGACTAVTSKLNKTGPCNQMQCNYGLPSGTTLTYDQNNDPPTIFIVNASASDIYNDSNTNYISRFQTIGSPFNVWQSQPYFVLEVVEAHDCALWWCLQSFDVVVNLGVQRQTNKTWTKFNFTSARNDVSGNLNLPADQFNPLNFTGMPASYNIASGTNYGVTPASIQGVAAFFAQLAGSVHGSTLYEFEYLPQYPTSDTLDDLVLGTWAHSDNMAGWISGVALSMSNTLRLNFPGSPSPKPSGRNNNTTDSFYLGQAATTIPLVQVRWPWLVFPACMVLAAIAFLIASVAQTHARREVRAWKSSPLALLFAGVEPEIMEHRGATANETGRQGHEVSRDGWMGRVGIGGVRVRLRREDKDKGGWAFRTS